MAVNYCGKKLYNIGPCGLHYKHIMIVIIMNISDAPICSVTYDRN